MPTKRDADGWPVHANLRHFTKEEFACKCGCGRAEMDIDFVVGIDCLRDKLGFPFYISSGYRCDNHNTLIGGGPAHPTGRAVDIRCFGGQARELVAEALTRGAFFQGIGVAQKGNQASRFIHLDCLQHGDTKAPRPWIWSY